MAVYPGIAILSFLLECDQMAFLTHFCMSAVEVHSLEGTLPTAYDLHIFWKTA